MREDIPKANKDNGKVWDWSVMGARYSAKERKGTQRKAMGYEGKDDRKSTIA